MKASVGNRVVMLLATSLYPNDGRVRREATALAAAGYQVSILCPRAYNHRRRQSWSEIIDGVSVYRYPAPPRLFNFIGYIWGYSYSIVAMFLLSLFILFWKGFDVVHTHNPPDMLVLIAAFYKLLGKRFVYDHHDLAPEMYQVIFGPNRLAYNTLSWFEKLSCRLADHVIATNQSYKQIEMQRAGIPATRITIVRNGPELDIVRPVEPDPVLRQKGKVIIGYVGAMGLHDGMDYLLRAIKHLIEDLGRTDFFCVLIGRGKYWEKMKSLSEQLGLTDFVWFTGYVEQPDLLRYLSTADICVAPEPSNLFNDHSTFIKVTEYIAMGKPIVTFDLPEHRVTADAAAVYALPNDELDFARKIAWLMDNPQQRKEMGQIGRQRAETKLAWAHQVKHLLAAYESLGLKATRSQIIRH